MLVDHIFWQEAEPYVGVNGQAFITLDDQDDSVMAFMNGQMTFASLATKYYRQLPEEAPADNSRSICSPLL